MSVSEKTRTLALRSDSIDVDVSAADGSFLLSIGPVSIEIDRATALEIAILLQNALLIALPADGSGDTLH